MGNSEFNNNYRQEDILKDEMMSLRLRLDSLEGTPIIMKLLVDLALVTKHRDEFFIDEDDFLEAIDEVNGWISDTEDLLKSEVH